jgi:tetratricopeptide (TPR) repeat protein
MFSETISAQTLPRRGVGSLRIGLLLVITVSMAGVRAQPGMPNSRISEYQRLWRGGEYARALEICEQVVAERPLNAGPLLIHTDHARLLAEVGRLDEAIAKMEAIGARYRDPAYTVSLALLYRSRGRLREYQQTLQIASMQAQSEGQVARVADSVAAVGRLMELQGENPRLILNTFYRIYMERLPYENAIRVAAGDLAYRKGSHDVAAEYYNAALVLEPDNQEALAGLAECYWKSRDPRLGETLDALMELNPNHRRALAILVEQQLDVSANDSALEIIDRRLQVNPNDARFLGLRAAALFLKDETGASSETQSRALRVNPHDADIFAIPARVASRHYRFEESVALLRRAVAADPHDTAAKADLALNLLRLDRQVEGRRLLEEAFEADAFNVRAFNLLEVLDSLDSFETIEDGTFRLQLPAWEARVLGDEILRTLRNELETYEARYAVRLTTPVLVQMFSDHDEFMVRSIGLPGNAGHMGICFGRLVTLDSPRARPPGTMNWRSVLWHEFVHVITLQKTRNRIPRWLSEGISVYEETQESTAWGQRLDARYKSYLDGETWPGVADLELYFTQPRSPLHLMLGYFASGEFVAFYVDRFGIGAMNAALDGIAEGRGAQEALAAAGEVSTQALDRAFKEYLKTRCASLANLPEAPSEDAASTLAMLAAMPDWMTQASPFVLAMGRGARAMENADWDAAEAAYREAYELFPDDAGPDAPLRRLAEIYRQTGEADKRRETLQRIVASDSTAFGECRQLLEIHTEAEEWEEAAAAAELAFDIDPFHVANLRDWRASLIRQGDGERALQLVMKLAYLDKARAVDHRFDRAALLAATGDREAAHAATVALLEELPHYWEAQELLLEIIEGRDVPLDRKAQ